MANKSNEALYEDVMSAIDRLYSDTSVSQHITRENLQTIIGEIEVLIETIDDDE